MQPFGRESSEHVLYGRLLVRGVSSPGAILIRPSFAPFSLSRRLLINHGLLSLVPPNVSSSWLLRKTKRRIWLRDIQPYVFCEKYRPTHQRRGRFGAFELAFAHSEAATRFQELFSGTPDASAASAAPDSTEGNDAVEPASQSSRSTEVNAIGEIGS